MGQATLLGTENHIGPTGRRLLPLSMVRPTDIGEAELGYLLLPEAWGLGYAAEACAAALGWFADARPGESVVERYEGYGAEQWLGVWPSVAR